jgi:uncharacterized membrane protein
MIRLVIVAYPHEYRAEEVLDTLTHLGREDLGGAWYVSRGSDGRVRLHRPIEQQFVIEFGGTLEPESSAILALIRHADADHLLAELVLYGGTVMQTSVASPA